MDTESPQLYGRLAIMALLDVARCDPRLTAQDVVVLQALGSRVCKDTVGLRTQAMIAYEMGVSRTTIGKHEKRLIQFGYISKTRRHERGRRNTYIYKFTIGLAQKHSSPEQLRRYGELWKTLCAVKQETPNGVLQRNPQKSAKPEPPNGDIKKPTSKESEMTRSAGVAAALPGFKPLSASTERLLEKVIKGGSF